MKELLDDYSIREKNLWFELLVDLAVAVYYWPQAFRLMTLGDEALRGGAMVNLIMGTVVVAVAVSVALSIFLHQQQKPEPMDERDYLIDARSSLLASRMLIGCLFIIMGHIVLQELSAGMRGAPASSVPFTEWSLTLSPLVIAHLLLVSLMLRSFTATLSRLYFYRKGL